MRISVKYAVSQLPVLAALFFISALLACSGKKEETPVIPPETSPLTGEYIGFGVITDSFTHITAEPAENSPSLGYLRRGSLVRIIKRQIIKTEDSFTSWVLTEGNQQGWLKEDLINIYDNEMQAKTASETMAK